MQITARPPDILEVIADLSNDEVFTPPQVANQVLDLLPPEVWTNPDLKWLDPGCKTGIFLREAARRLLTGLEGAIPNKEERLSHIMTNMLHGIAITSITAMMSRRSLYCSKDATSERSVVKFDNPEGNIWFKRTDHTYAQGRCVECGARESDMEKEGKDNYAYAFIHEKGRKQLEKVWNMKFDVIIGNPPYQMSTSNETAQAKPVYNLFVEEAFSLEPQFVTMIIPSRWMTGGMGLDGFRELMLKRKSIKKIHDFQFAQTIFPQINLTGGVCYFLDQKSYNEDCQFTFTKKDGSSKTDVRSLAEYDLVVRDSLALQILRKVQKVNTDSFSELVQPINVFGLPTTWKPTHSLKRQTRSAIMVRGLKANHLVTEAEVTAGKDLLDKVKIIIPKATDGNEVYPLPVITEPEILGERTACTMTYLVIGPFRDLASAEVIVSYMKTKFFRFMLAIRKQTQNNSKDKFKFIPTMKPDGLWTDRELYEFFELTKEEIDLIENEIREMN